MPSLISVKLPGFADRDAHWERVIRRTESTDHPSAANVIPLNVWKWRLSYCWSQRAASAYTSSDTIWKMHPGRLSRWDKIHFDPSPLWHSEGKFDWFIRPASPQPPFNETVIAHGRPALHRRREKKCGQNVKYNQFSTHTDEEWEENETCGQKEDGETEHMCRCQKNNITKKTNTNMTEGIRKKKSRTWLYVYPNQRSTPRGSSETLKQRVRTPEVNWQRPAIQVSILWVGHCTRC